MILLPGLLGKHKGIDDFIIAEGGAEVCRAGDGGTAACLSMNADLRIKGLTLRRSRVYAPTWAPCASGGRRPSLMIALMPHSRPSLLMRR